MELIGNSIENKLKFVISGIINTVVQFPRNTVLSKITASFHNSYMSHWSRPTNNW
jgi:hypothetical protein